MRRVTVLICAVLLLATVVGAQQTTGRLTGTVADSDGQPLPGVTVTISSPNLIGGAQSAITDAAGQFSFLALPPGMYDVRADLPGFAPAELDARVNLARQTDLRIQLVLQEFADEIQVVAEAPVVDPSQVSTGEVFDQNYLQNAAIGSGGRDYLSIIGQAAGVAGTGNVNVHGSTYSENNYLIDGLTTTDVVTGTFGTNFNYDAIQEINFITGGFEAEYGQATGGIVNLVTKSGGNEFSGTFDTRYRDQDFNESGDHFDPDDAETSRQSFDATLGGPIVRDKVWFFVSGGYSYSEYTPPDSPATDEREFVDYIAKATWQAADSTRVVAKISGDPATIDNYNTSEFVAPEALAFQEQGGNTIQAEISSVLSESILLSAQVGVNRQELESSGQSGDIHTSGWYDLNTGISFNNYSSTQDSERDRNQLRVDLTWFVDELAGSHEFKSGVEYHDMTFSGRLGYAGEGLHYVYSDFPDLDGDGYMDFYIVQNWPAGSQFEYVDSEGELYTLFLQDAWRPTSNLTVKPGVRWDAVEYVNDVGDTVADLDRVQPRFGLAWDILNDGKHLARVSWGRFMHPSALGIPDFISGRNEGYRYLYGYEYLCGYVGNCDVDYWVNRFGNLGEPFEDERGNLWIPFQDTSSQSHTVDTLGVGTLSAPYAEELIVSYEQQIFDNTSIEVSYVDKKTRSLMEDTCINNTWAWGDGPEPSFDDPDTWTSLAGCSAYVLMNVDELERNYTGYIAKFETRARDWFHLLASYTYAESEGNTEARMASPAESYIDTFPTGFFNLYGSLADDRRHRVKLSGYFLLPLDFTVGVDAFYSSEAPLDVMASCSDIVQVGPDGLAAAGYDPTIYDLCFDSNGVESSDDLFLEPRGNRRSDTDRYQLDLQVAKGFNLGDVRLEGIVTVINALSDEQPISWYTTEFGAREWGTVLDWSNPRRYEVGFRIEF